MVGINGIPFDNIPSNNDSKVSSIQNQNNGETQSQVTSYDNSDANLAVINNHSAFIKKKFVPAKTKEEFEKQIKSISWADEKSINFAIKRLGKIKTSDIPLYSELFHKFDALSDDLKKAVKLPHYLDSSFSSSYRENINSFSPETLNKIDPEIQKKFADKIVNYADIYVISDPDGINLLYKTLNDNDRDVIFKNSLEIFGGTNEANKGRIKKAEALNILFEQVKKDINDLYKVIINDYTPKQVQLLVDYLNQLKNKGITLPPHQLTNLLNSNYSYSIENQNLTPKAGTSAFKPFTTKSELQIELSSMRTENGMFMFSNEDINLIINNENDIFELSRVLDAVKKSSSKLSGYDYKNLLESEGITLAAIEKQLAFIQKANNDESYSDLKDIVNKAPYEIIKSTEQELEKIEQNAGLIQPLKTLFPDCFNAIKMPAVMSILKNANVSAENFQKLVDLDLYPNKLDLSDCREILNNANINNFKQQHIDFIKAIKSEPKLSFLFDKKNLNSVSNYTINYILTRQISPDYSIKAKSDIIDFLYDLQNSDEKSIINSASIPIDLLLRQADDNADDGRKIVQFIKQHNLIDCNSYKYLTQRPFSETLDLLQKFDGNSYIRSFDFICDDNTLLEDFDNYYELISYAQSFDSLKTGIKLDSKYILDSMNAKRGMNLEPVSKEKIKAEILALDAISKQTSPQLWEAIKEQCLQNILEDMPMTKYNFNQDNIAYFSQFASDSRTAQLFDPMYLNYIDLLQANIDIDSIKANKEKMYDFVTKYCNDDFRDKYQININKYELITFDGDFDKFEAEIKKLVDANQMKKMYVQIDEFNNVTIYNETDGIEKTYSKDFKLLSKKVAQDDKDEFGNPITKIHISDKKLNIEHDIISTSDPITNFPIPLEIKSDYYDDNHNLIKTKTYERSNVDGVVIVKEKYPSGEIRILSDYSETDNGIKITKQLESPEGVVTVVDFTKDLNANEEYFYKITDKNGHILTELRRSIEIQDANTKITKVNDKSYKVTTSDGKITVYDFQSGETTQINLTEMNPECATSLNDMLKTLSGDELINLKKYVSSLSLTQRIESAMDPISRTMYIGPHKFVLEHELGHAKDYILATIEELLNVDDQDALDSKIASDSELQTIFKEEKEALRRTTSTCLQDELNYFINDTTHYNGKLGGLKETIAEVNAIQNTPQYHSLLQTRTQLLQEYFPRTVAYLINNYYA